MLDIKEKRHITVVGRGGASNIDWEDIENKPDFATVATSGSYNDLTDKPEIPGQVNADWDATSGVAQILNKPELAAVATSGSYNDLSDKPSMSTDIPEDKNNAIIIYNESGNTTFTQGVWGGGPIPTEIWQNGVKVTGSITSPYPLVNGKSVIMETLNGEPNTSMEDFEFADKNATIWVYADFKRYNHPISGTYTGDINVVLNNNEAGYNLTQNSSGVKYWLLDNNGQQIRVANNNTIILSDKSLQLHFEGTVTSASDFNLTIYVPKTQYNNLVALLQATFPDIPDITWITDHINQYDYIVSDGYKLRMVTEPAAQVNSDWNASSGVQQILNKPTLATVATSGDYTDLSNTPSLATVATSGDYSDLSNTPSLATVATTGSYPDLLDTPNLATVATSGSYNDLSNTPNLATVATSGDYTDLSNTPNLATVATSGSYSDLSNTPTIPTVPAMAIQELTFTMQGGTTKIIEFYTVPDYFYVEDISGSDNTLSIKKNNADAPTIEVFKSTDKINWTSIGTTSTTAITATVPANSRLYLKATTNSWSNSYKGHRIAASGNHNIGGNIMSLIYGDDFVNKFSMPSGTSYNLSSLFSGNNKLINISNLDFYVTTLTGNCYYSMFWGCTSLTTAPALPATTLASNCYNSMFYGCTSLATTPVLPATTMVNGCYQAMFQGCTSLTTAPELPATTLYSSCYQEMFRNCTALTTAPELPATTLATSCYQQMFRDCTNLNSVTTYASNISVSNCLTNWLSGVSATGDFYNFGGATYPSGVSGIPTGWTEHTSL